MSQLEQLLQRAKELSEKTLHKCPYHHDGFCEKPCMCHLILGQWELQECQTVLGQLIKFIPNNKPSVKVD